MAEGLELSPSVLATQPWDEGKFFVTLRQIPDNSSKSFSGTLSSSTSSSLTTSSPTTSSSTTSSSPSSDQQSGSHGVDISHEQLSRFSATFDSESVGPRGEHSLEAGVTSHSPNVQAPGHSKDEHAAGDTQDERATGEQDELTSDIQSKLITGDTLDEEASSNSESAGATGGWQMSDRLKNPSSDDDSKERETMEDALRNMMPGLKDDLVESFADKGYHAIIGGRDAESKAKFWNKFKDDCKAAHLDEVRKTVDEEQIQMAMMSVLGSDLADFKANMTSKLQSAIKDEILRELDAELRAEYPAFMHDKVERFVTDSLFTYITEKLKKKLLQQSLKDEVEAELNAKLSAWLANPGKSANPPSQQ